MGLCNIKYNIKKEKEKNKFIYPVYQSGVPQSIPEVSASSVIESSESGVPSLSSSLSSESGVPSLSVSLFAGFCWPSSVASPFESNQSGAHPV